MELRVGWSDGGFKSADARRQYLAAYDELRALSPRPDVVHDVPTKFGSVRVYQHGPDRGVPVVLIHGFFLTSAMWWGQVEGLTGDFTVYAMDMLGQPGASIQTKTMFTPADCARCIDAVLGAWAARCASGRPLVRRVACHTYSGAGAPTVGDSDAG